MQFSSLHYIAVYCSKVQFTAVQYSAVQCIEKQCNVLQLSKIQCSTMQCSALYCSVVQYITVLHRDAETVMRDSPAGDSAAKTSEDVHCTLGDTDMAMRTIAF